MTTPYMPMYWADYDADTTYFTALEHGVYLMLIKTYWQSQKPLPNDDNKLWRIARLDSKEQWLDVRETIAEAFVITERHWKHKRIDAELKKFRERSEKNRAAGRKGGQAAGSKGKSDKQPLSERLAESETKTKQTLSHTDTDTDTSNKPPNPQEGELDLGLMVDQTTPSPVDTAYQLWNELADQHPKLPKAKNIDGPAKQSLRRRLKQDGLDGFREALDGIRASPWHRNEGDWNGMCLGWLVKAANYEKMRQKADEAPAIDTRTEGMKIIDAYDERMAWEKELERRGQEDYERKRAARKAAQGVAN